MSRKRTGTIKVEAEVDVGCAEVLEECRTEDLIAELHRRGDELGDADHPDPLTRIWRAVMHHGQTLEEAVSDLMRERTWPWRTGGGS